MYLIDTDTVIYALKGDTQVLKHFQETAAEPKALSVVTYGELLYGALKSQRQRENLAKVRRLQEIFPIVEATSAIMESYAAIKADIEARGKPLDDFDLVIAATAISLSYRLVTNNERHFRRIRELKLENWTRRDPHSIRPNAMQQSPGGRGSHPR